MGAAAYHSRPERITPTSLFTGRKIGYPPGSINPPPWGLPGCPSSRIYVLGKAIAEIYGPLLQNRDLRKWLPFRRNLPKFMKSPFTQLATVQSAASYNSRTRSSRLREAKKSGKSLWYLYQGRNWIVWQGMEVEGDNAGRGMEKTLEKGW
ncbi:unnamed protein product [Nezara viridula]|uniref:Uncharacterized protein n=1 Tax=Nezara viridula TaxID=85310 RepID=A0A9P0HDU4_NEZVI|nr:unnamed protein product [Nezara viridula]